MKISILGTNGLLSAAIAKYANEKGWTLDMYGLDEPVGHKYDNFYKVNLMDSELEFSGLYIVSLQSSSFTRMLYTVQMSICSFV